MRTRSLVILGVVGVMLIVAGAAVAASSWTVVSMPNPGRQGTDMHDVAAIPRTADAWAVGQAFTRSGAFPSLDFWDGASWTAATIPASISNPAGLNGVAAQDANHAWAVGSSRTTMSNTLAISWNGSTWSTMSPLNVTNSVFDEFTDVAALGHGSIMAVGEYSDSADVDHTLAELHTASGWTVYTPVPLDLSTLSGVSAVPGTGTAWAVGQKKDLALILYWDGSTWSEVPDASTGTFSTLRGVVGLAADDVWAVGSQGPSRDQTTPLIEHYDGVSWSVVPAPAPPASSDPVVSLYSIAAVPGRQTLWAVGEKDNTLGRPATFTERWNGTAWVIIQSPDPNHNNVLEGVAATHDETLAVGYQYGNPRSSLGLTFP